MINCKFCGKTPVVESFKPFCSARCTDLDLGQWLSGGYAIPTQEQGPSVHSDPDELDPYAPAND